MSLLIREENLALKKLKTLFNGERQSSIKSKIIQLNQQISLKTTTTQVFAILKLTIHHRILILNPIRKDAIHHKVVVDQKDKVDKKATINRLVYKCLRSKDLISIKHQ
jgi:hypothetical protein